MHYLIIGLGNIGPEYTFTRHNIGFQILDCLSIRLKCEFSLRRLAFYATAKHRNNHLHLIKPTTYMNLSGKSVRYWVQTLHIPIENILVTVDDLALPFGKLRLRNKGSMAGHNGLKSIELALNTISYPRLKFGIGNHFPKGQQANYVLTPFNETEMHSLPLLVDKACEIIESFCIAGIVQTMTRYN